ncbi:MAG: CoA transferase, partial [Deltaproteobacteria bacterium]|nr:CoA transferase [Deltaproteobacteria bacterium]
VPVAPVNDIPSLFTDPHVQHMDLFKEIMSVEGKPIKISRLPFRMSKFLDQEYGPAPRVGEHTESVLSDLAGVTPQEMEMLSREGVIGI